MRATASLILLALLLTGALPAMGQHGGPPPPVRTTEARSLDLRRSLRLTGTVEAHVQSLLATEVAGLVIALPAREGSTVKRGAVIARLRTDERELRLEAAKGLQLEAQARLEGAERQLTRTRGLLDNGAISEDQYDDAVSEFNAWQGRIYQLDAEIQRLELDLTRCTIRALFDGAIVAEHCEVGEWIIVGGAVVEMVAMDDLEIRVELPERWYADLQLGAPVQVQLASLAGVDIRGAVVAIIPRANPQARTFPVRIQIEDADPRIGAGMLAEVEIAVGEAQPALVVPKDAIANGPAGTVVWVVSQEDTVAPVPVTVGDAQGIWVSVEGDLTPGDLVVVRGNERLQPGAPVQPSPLEYPLP